MSHNISSQAEQARENARQTDGKFGTYSRSRVRCLTEFGHHIRVSIRVRR